ncbi:MAG: RtcB family protein [Bacteroidales bacterium]|nr:RtcB family protein [Bacteroidales bacterium]
MMTIKGNYTEARIYATEIEEECIQQIKQLVNHPAFTHPIAIMPDAHAGKGAVIGFTTLLTDKVIPNVIGVDIGCGMLTAHIRLPKNTNMEKLDKHIKKLVPMSTEIHKKTPKNDFSFKEVNQRLQKFVQHFNKKYHSKYKADIITEQWLIEKFKQIQFPEEKFFNSLGTLGGGNHFIEIGKSEKDNNYLIIHSGSRHFGNKIATYWQNVAIKLMDKRKKKEDINKQLSYLENEHAFSYLTDMVVSQYYASINRKTILQIILENNDIELINSFETIHNYIDFEDFIIRKGAIRSYKGEVFVVPINMRDGTLICEGKSEKLWNFSAPHGAGRKLSRNKAKSIISLEEFRQSMQGIVSSSISKDTIDESPFAYKDMNYIIQSITPTAQIIEHVKPQLNIKAKE